MNLQIQDVNTLRTNLIDLVQTELHNEVMEFTEWLRSLPGSPTPTLAANHSGLAGPTLIRHAQRGKTTADNVITISRAYGVPAVDALVDMGFLNIGDVSDTRMSIRTALKEATVAEILDELVEKVNNSGLFEGKFDSKDLSPATISPIRSVEHSGTPDVADEEYDDDDLIDGINNGTIKHAAQEATDPLDETWS